MQVETQTVGGTLPCTSPLHSVLLEPLDETQALLRAEGSMRPAPEALPVAHGSREVRGGGHRLWSPKEELEA